jgi:Holliday junction resolvase-like predicted endonuclease
VPKLCEIDIIAFKDQRVYFVEVKYRLRSLTGGGLAAITALKLRHMRRAAQIWVRQQGFAGGYDLAAIEVGGADFAIGDFIASIY